MSAFWAWAFAGNAAKTRRRARSGAEEKWGRLFILIPFSVGVSNEVGLWSQGVKM
jgi:hypothetical protein